MLTFATDCTGMDAARCSLQRLVPKHKLRYVWASDVDPVARGIISKQALVPECTYEDATILRPALPILGTSPSIYIVGPPCQSWSGLSNRKGFQDPRGGVLTASINTIASMLPAIFVIENVKQLKFNNKGDDWVLIMDALARITDPKTKQQAYTVDHKILSPHHLGFPQSRARVFIVGRRKVVIGEAAKGAFPWPTPKAVEDGSLSNMLMPHLEAIAKSPRCCRQPPPCAARGMKNIQAKLRAKRLPCCTIMSPRIVDVMTSVGRERTGTLNVSPCLTSRSKELFVLNGNSRGRFLAFDDCMRIQGYSEESFAKGSLDVNRTDRFRLIGNSIHVGVLTSILKPCVAMLECACNEHLMRSGI
jgi:DNA-cytosine methyltransferase